MSLALRILVATRTYCTVLEKLLRLKTMGTSKASHHDTSASAHPIDLWTTNSAIQYQLRSKKLELIAVPVVTLGLRKKKILWRKE